MSVKPRPRPRAFHPRPNRPEQILAAACGAIQQRGFANTRMADVAREAGMSTGAIHYWFEAKAERLIAEVDGLGFELLLGYSWTSPERMCKRLYAFAAEQLGIDRPGLEREARAVIAALDGGSG
jgi:AcrR family transcriptional regulator